MAEKIRQFVYSLLCPVTLHMAIAEVLGRTKREKVGCVFWTGR